MIGGQGGRAGRFAVANRRYLTPSIRKAIMAFYRRSVLDLFRCVHEREPLYYGIS
jgi:hypothetical protein